MYNLTTAAQINAAVQSARDAVGNLGDGDTAFFSRCYNEGDLDKYRQRIQALGFSDLERVIDIGCGFGQWSIVLAESNDQVIATDIDSSRINIAKQISAHLGLNSIDWITAPMLDVPLPSQHVDAIFSYNALALSPYRETLAEFARLLKPGGLLYFNSYDLGWMIYNIIEQHNPAADFDPRQWAIDAIKNTLQYLSDGTFEQSTSRDSLLTPLALVRHDLGTLGFNILSEGGDGMTSINGDGPQAPFFPAEKYGLPAVYEMLCKRR